jgi:hypothetical protein
MLNELQCHPLPPWLAMMRKVAIGVMLFGAVLDQYQQSLAVTSWMSKVIDQQDEATSAPPPPPSFYFHLFDQNVAKETTMTTKMNTNAQLKDGNQGQSQGNNNDDDDNNWKLPFHGRIDIPIYTAAMARDAVQPQWGFCHFRQRTPPSSVRLLDNDSNHHQHNNSVKFAFVHIFKTAGSTLREFFFLYSHHCALGWMVLISCTNSQASSSSSRRMLPKTTTSPTYTSSSSNITTDNDHDTTDRNSNSNNLYWEPCILKKLLQRDGTFSNLTQLLLTQQQLDEEHENQQQQQLLGHSNRSSSSSYYKNKTKKSTKKLNKKRVYPALVAESVDLLGGHFKIGMADDFVQPSLYASSSSSSSSPLSHSNTKIRHITFVRQPLPKYVSGKVFHHKEIQSQEEIIALIKHDVTQARRAGEYWMRVSNYLLTPLQQQQQQAATTTTTNRRSNSSSSSSTSSNEYTTQLILNNLVHYNVIVGIVEDMSQSMTLLQHVLDPDQKMTLLFTHYGGGRDSSTTTSKMTTTVHPDDRKTTTLLLQPSNAPTMDKKNSSTIVMDTSSSSSRQQQRQQQHVVNKSRFSTSSILKELETTDPAFFQEFIDYVKYEQLVYDFAWNMHQQQYQAAILPP